MDNSELARMIAEDGSLGLTSNPTIFEKAIGGSRDYDAEITQMAAQGVASFSASYDKLLGVIAEKMARLAS